jgi:hypothetical protein
MSWSFIDTLIVGGDVAISLNNNALFCIGRAFNSQIKRPDVDEKRIA